MDLILWRHPEAEDGFPDLTRERRILVSPTTRTQQTVATFSKHFTLAPTLSPGASALDVLQAARWPDSGGTVLVVGHQPTLGEVAAHLLYCKDISLSIKKGSLWWFNLREGTEQVNLRLVITPDFL